jgi:hypothetical protein
VHAHPRTRAIEWRPEESTEDVDIKESAESAQEGHPDEKAITDSAEWFECPEEPEFKWFEEPKDSAADAGIRETVKYLLEDAIEVAKKVSTDWWRQQSKKNAGGSSWAERGRTDQWRSGESFAEWQKRVETGAGKLADDFRKLEEVTGSWRRSGGVLNWWKKDRVTRWQHAATARKRHRTSREMRKMWIRRDREAEEATRAWKEAHGSAGERE